MFYDQTSQNNVTLVMHYQGAGGSEAAYSTFIAPEVLLRHGIAKAIRDTGFSKLDLVSADQLYRADTLREELEIAEEIGKNLGQKVGTKANNGRELVGFPFSLQNTEYIFASSKYLEVPAYHIKPNDAKPLKGTLESAINNLHLLRITHTSDYLASLATLIKGDFLIHLSGTHDGDIGAVSAVSTYFRRMGLKVGLVSFDAHGDYNGFQISPSGNLHGMHNAVYTLKHMRREGYLAFLGSMQVTNPERKVDPRNMLHVGGRAFDPLEEIILREDGVNLYTMHEIRHDKSQNHLPQAFEEKLHKAMQGVDGLVVSIDWDVLDPDIEEVKPDSLAVTYQEPHGLLTEDLKLMLRTIAQSNTPVMALLVSELNSRNWKDAQIYLGRTIGDFDEKSFDVAIDLIHDFLLANRGRY